MTYTRNERLALFAMLPALPLAVLGGWTQWGLPGGLSVLAAIAWLPIAQLVDLRRRQRDGQRAAALDAEAVAAIHGVLRLRHPLPPMGRYGLAPRSAMVLVREILAQRPAHMVEFGSGVSTLLAAYCMERLGRGRVLSFEHDARFARNTSELLVQHGLTDYAEVVHRPLDDVEVAGRTWRWYRIDVGDLPDRIQLLFVDGPPRRTGRLARYPALPVCASRLDPDAAVLLDDGDRRDERRIVRRWLREQPGFRDVSPPEVNVAVLRHAAD